jgi:hypothetical protein
MKLTDAIAILGAVTGVSGLGLSVFQEIRHWWLDRTSSGERRYRPRRPPSHYRRERRPTRYQIAIAPGQNEKRNREADHIYGRGAASRPRRDEDYSLDISPEVFSDPEVIGFYLRDSLRWPVTGSRLPIPQGEEGDQRRPCPTTSDGARAVAHAVAQNTVVDIVGSGPRSAASAGNSRVRSRRRHRASLACPWPSCESGSIQRRRATTRGQSRGTERRRAIAASTSRWLAS